MRHVRALLVLGALTSLSGCNDREPALPEAAGPKEKLTRFTFMIDGTRYAISLPEQAGMREQQDPASITFDARKTQRLQKIMALSAKPDPANQPFDRTYRLRDGSGRVVQLRTAQDGEGSGGLLESIVGRIELGQKTLFLYCSDQSESAPFADWCLDYLQTLEVIPASSGRG